MTFTDKIEVRLVNQTGDDRSVVAAAKVSTNGEEAAKFIDQEASFGLINYLMKCKHGSPFEHNCFSFFVSAPLFVWREHHRHRVGFSYNEESGRYKKLEPKFWIPKETRKIVQVNGYKPSRPEFQQGTQEQYSNVINKLKEPYSLAYKSYEILVNSDYAKEVSRACLPVGIYSSCWVTCNARSLMHFLSLRTHDKTAKFVSFPQEEIEEVARQYEEIFAEKMPLTYKAYVENGRVAP